MGFFLRISAIFRPLPPKSFQSHSARYEYSRSESPHLSWPTDSPEPSFLLHPDSLEASLCNHSSNSSAVMLTSSLNSLQDSSQYGLPECFGSFQIPSYLMTVSLSLTIFDDVVEKCAEGGFTRSILGSRHVLLLLLARW